MRRTPSWASYGGVRAMADDVDVSDFESAEKAKIMTALRSERKARNAAERELKELRVSAALAAQPSADMLAVHVDALVRAEVAKQNGSSALRLATLEHELAEAKSKLSDLNIRIAVKEAAGA